LTHLVAPIYSVRAMASTDIPTSIQEQDLRALEVRVEELIRACAHLKDENKTLRAEVEHLSTERDRLIETNATARARVETMISRLKTMEGES
jgi:cell division protein ZapB